MYGWMGKILHVNLTTSKISELSTEPYSRQYLGGRGVAARLYWETVGPQVKAFDPENRLVLMTGPLVATGAQAASRLSFVSKSPQTFPEAYCSGSMGGFVGAEFKKAGFDGIVVDGRADKPVYLWIHDGVAELREASFLWGQGTYGVIDQLKQVHGEKTQIISIGIAGENKVRISVIVGDHESVCDAGFGAVMGSKNLKAVAVRGTGKPTISHPDKLKELNRYTVSISKRLRLGFLDWKEAGRGMVKRVGNRGCYQCGLECEAGRYRLNDGQETIRKCQSQEVYLPWQYSKEEQPVETLFDAPKRCNDYAVDTYELYNILNWLYKCYQSGCLNEEETGLPLSMIGTREFLEILLHAISFREGFGEILAEGFPRACERIPTCARESLEQGIAAIGLGMAEQPRGIVVLALLSATEPRLRRPISHAVTLPLARWAANLRNPNLSHVNSKVFRNAAMKFWGSEDAGDLSSYEGKALAAIRIQNRVCIMDSLGLCGFAWPIMESMNTPDHVGDPNLEARLFSAVTGLPCEVIDEYGERIFTIQRAILAREGWQGVVSDSIPEYNFTEPLQTNKLGSRALVPGFGDEPVSVQGKILDREKFFTVRREYYQLRGWDQDIGIPLESTLVRLGIEELATDFSTAVTDDNTK